MNEQVNQTTNIITDDELADVVRIARKERGGKSVKYIKLEKYRESILRLMQQDVQLSHILRWLTNKHGEQLVLNTLRKYVARNIGREVYEEYLTRNRWIKTKGRKKPGVAGVVGFSDGPTHSLTGSSTGTGLDFLDFKKPPALKRAIDDESEKK